MTIRNCKKYHCIHDTKLQHNFITTKKKKLRTNEASKVLLNNKTINYCHKKLHLKNIGFRLTKYNIMS